MVAAQRLARAREQPEVEGVHVLMALLDVPEAAALLRAADAEPARLRAPLEDALAKLPRVPDESVYLSAGVLRMLDVAQVEARERGGGAVEPAHILLAIPLESRSRAAAILRDVGVTVPKLDAAWKRGAGGGAAGAGIRSTAAALVSSPSPSRGEGAAVGVAATNEQPLSDRYPTLARFTRDLTELAAQGRLDPVVGRDAEIRRVLQILGRRTKNSPLLVGEPGVGKTAVVEGLAQRLAAGDVPLSLAGRRLLALDIGGLVAGTRLRGELEERLRAILAEAGTSDGEVLIFIDEIHALVGAGGGDGSLDAASLLKPALARGELTCIGATTVAEYRTHIEKDAAFARRFQPLTIEEPDNDTAVAMLRGVKRRYEERHGVRVLDPAIVAAVSLARRYVPGRALPDKAIDSARRGGQPPAPGVGVASRRGRRARAPRARAARRGRGAGA